MGAMKRNLRRDAKAILMSALAAADPTAAVEQVLRTRDDLNRYERIFVVGGPGKAGGTMARAVEQLPRQPHIRAARSTLRRAIRRGPCVSNSIPAGIRSPTNGASMAPGESPKSARRRVKNDLVIWFCFRAGHRR